MRKYIIISTVLLVFFLARVNCQVIIDSVNVTYNIQPSYIAEILNDLDGNHLKKLTNYKISDNQISSEQVLSFLNRDFKTDVFNQFDFLKSCNFQIIIEERTLHLGIIELGFSSKSELEKAYKIVKAVNRSNFNLKVLTEFTVLRKNESLIFLFSETSYDPLIRSFFNRMNRTYTQMKDVCRDF